MKIAIMQPTFNPWLGYFDLINSVDVFVFLDNVQLARRSWQVRNKIKANGQELFITIPIKKTSHRNDLLIKEAIINDFEWVKKALRVIKHNYSKSEYFKEIYPYIESLLLSNINTVSEFNINIIKNISDHIGINTNFIKSSSLHDLSGSKDDLLLAICKNLNATSYISPQGSSAYLIENNSGYKYEKNNIKLYYTDYLHPHYNQLGKKFIEYLGVFDLLLNNGFKKSLNIIKSGHKDNIFYKDFDYENR